MKKCVNEEEVRPLILILVGLQHVTAPCQYFAGPPFFSFPFLTGAGDSCQLRLDSGQKGKGRGEGEGKGKEREGRWRAIIEGNYVRGDKRPSVSLSLSLSLSLSSVLCGVITKHYLTCCARVLATVVVLFLFYERFFVSFFSLVYIE